MVQVRVTLSPLRAARKSEGAFGNSSEAGNGGPTEAHPVNQTSPATASNNCPSKSFMPEATDYIIAGIINWFEPGTGRFNGTQQSKNPGSLLRADSRY
jgi:hypothetical protein